ncbi:MAG TPA: hypothetical protein VN213_12620 [Solirubrobacteraceae bacterium]|nr:hypothetical protein [Solirubrobacteraceae bacterium]
MATTTKTPFADFYNVEEAVQRWTEATRKAGQDYVDLYDKTVDQITELEVKAAAATKLPLVTQLVDTHVTLTREVAGVYSTAARDLLKA